MSGTRLPRGGRIDRSRALSFTFDGRRYPGLAGDTLASALLANGVSLVGRSFKYHRPRGILSAGPEEPNALVELRTHARREPNTRATQIELYEGLAATSQNRWPSLALDARAVNGWFAPLLHAGFYYKTFMWPARFWERVYEPLIRRAAGLGRASAEPDPDDYEKCTLHADVLVIGSGPAGLAAARAAALGGARVVLCEQDHALGGQLLGEPLAGGAQALERATPEGALTIDGLPAAAWAEQVVAQLQALPDVTLLPRTTVFGASDHGQYAAIERVWDHAPEPAPFEPRQRLWRIVARSCVLATGALERPLVFDDNDRPGVMLASAVRSYVNRYAVLPGREAVVFATHDDVAHTVHALARAGARVAAVVDPRPSSSPALRQAAEVAGARLLAGAVVERAVAAGWPALAGAGQVCAAQVRGPSGTQRLDCDLLVMGGGFTPTLHLSSHTGHKPRWDAHCAAFVPADLPPGMHAAGAVTGGGTLAQCLAQGTAAGLAALREIGLAAPELRVPEGSDEAHSLTPLWRVSRAGAKAFVDFQHDVTADDLALAAREGFSRPELMKRYTTLGMGTDQGKTSNVIGLALLAAELGRTIPQVGTTTFRAPYTPVTLGAFPGHAVGLHIEPVVEILAEQLEEAPDELEVLLIPEGDEATKVLMPVLHRLRQAGVRA
ncbi:MAG: 2Fe-2S iron-sulfur cluster-binding protein, partial [Rubrivivax sp.]